LNKESFENALKSLSADDYIKLNVIERKEIELTEEGRSYAQNGSPEYQFVSSMKMGEVTTMVTMEEKVG
jgi:Mn-dependent DtxR family transcriptional regulator